MSKYIHWLVKKIWILFAVVLISTAVVVQCGRMLAPMVSEHKDDIGDYLSSRLGLEVSFGKLTFEWGSLRPELNFSDLKIIAAGEKTVLAVNAAEVEIDILGSLLARDLRIWQIGMDGVELNLAENDDGSWMLEGIELSPKDDTPSKDNDVSAAINNMLGMLLIGRQINFKNVLINFYQREDGLHQLELTSLLLQNDDEFHRLNTSFNDGEGHKLIDFIFEGFGDPRQVSTFTGQGYLKVDSFPLHEHLALFLKDFMAKEELAGALLSSELWLSSSAENRLSVLGNLNVYRDASTPERTEANKQRLQSISTNLTGRWQIDQGWRLDLQKTALTWLNNSTETDISISSDVHSGSLNLYVEDLALDSWAAVLKAEARLPDSIKDLVAALDPKGSVQNLDVLLPNKSPKDFVVKANLVDVSIDPWHGVPGVKHLNGYVESTSAIGFVDIDSANHFEVFFPSVYKKPIVTDLIRGQVKWSVNKEANQIFVNSGLLELSGDVGSVKGYFSLDSPLEANSRPAELILQLGLIGSDVLQHKVLVPYTLSENLLSWLDQALLGGDVPEAGFVLRNYWTKGQPIVTSTQLSIDVEAGDLKFDPQWPELNDFSAFVSLDDKDLSGVVDHARLLGSNVKQVEILLKGDNPQGDGSLLLIEGDVVGRAEDGLALLVDTPLRKTFGSTFDAWRLSGALNSHVNLAIPLAAGEPGAAQDIKVSLRNAQLNMDDLNLEFKAITGALTFRSDTGLRASGLAATLWGEPLQARVDSAVVDDGFRTVIGFDTQVEMRDVADWLSRPEVRFAEGKAPFTGSMILPAPADKKDYSALLTFNSDLEGVVVDLPEPYGKASDAASVLNVEARIKGGQQSYTIAYKNLIQVQLEQANGQLRAGLGRILKASQPNLMAMDAENLPDTGLLIDGELAIADVDAWLDTIQRYGGFSGEYTTESEGDTDSFPLNLSLSVDQLGWGDLAFDGVELGGEAIEDGWAINVHHPVVGGTVYWYEKRPLTLDLDYFYWPTGESDNPDEPITEEDPLAGLDPRDLIAMDVKIEDVRIGDLNLGRWSFSVNPEVSGIEVTELQADILGAKLGAKPEQQAGAKFSWVRTENGDRSHFDGMVYSTDLVSVWENFGQPKLLEAENTRLISDVAWHGSPAMVSLSGLQGQVILDVDKGRFFKVTGQASSALLRLLGLFNFDSWARRLQLDFSDVYKTGMSFDSINGKLDFAEGKLFITEPVVVDTLSASLQMGGQINLRKETLDTTMVATLPVSSNAAVIAALAGGLPVALGVYAVSKIFKTQVDNVGSASYEMKGSWTDPEVKFKRLFDGKAAKDATKDVRKESEEAKQRDAECDSDC